MEVEAAEKPKSKPLAIIGKSLWIFPPENKLRLFCAKIVCHRHFDNVILFLIVFSTFMLILESPLMDPKS